MLKKGSTIKPKTGKCADCSDNLSRVVTKVTRIGEDGEKENVLLCSAYHYKKHRAKENAKKKTAIKSQDRKKRLTIFFNDQLKNAPNVCENCGQKIIIPYPLPKRTAVCHIVPKSDFRSVETHPENKWFGCVDCHTKYDKYGHNNQALMPVSKVVIERFGKFKHLITPREANRLPEYLYNEYYKEYYKGNDTP